MKFKKELEVVATLERSVIKPNEETELRCLFQVRTEKADVEKRKPVELACVLDVSGSMQIEDKLKWSKRAIRKIIKHLNPMDRLHFIIYDLHVRIVFENGDLADKEKLINHVRSVEIGTSTNIGLGLESAYEILKKNEDPLFESSKRIFLFSDGHANEGIRTDEGLFALIRKYREDGISTSSFGIGSDFKASLMTGISTIGGGRYFFLANKSSITKQVSRAIHGLLDQIGSNGVITLRGLNGCEVEELTPTTTTSPIPLPDNDEEEEEEEEEERTPMTPMTRETSIEVGDLFSENCKNILIKFLIPPLQANDKIGFCEFELRYESRIQGVVNTKGSVSLRVQDVEDYSQYESTLVKISMKVKAAARRNAKIAKFLSESKVNDAVDVMNELIADLEKFVDMDETGKIKRLVEKAKIDLEKMRMHSDLREVQQRRDFTSYQCNEDEDDGMLASPCDSDEGNWTPDAPMGFDPFGNVEDDDDDGMPPETPDMDDDDGIMFNDFPDDNNDDDDDSGEE